MPSLTFIVPGRLDDRSGGSIYDRRIVHGLRALGWRVDVAEFDRSFPRPSEAALREASRALSAMADGATVMIDGLVLGAIPDLAQREASRLRIVALVHLPLACEVGLDEETVRRFERDERRALAAARAVVVTGRATVDLVQQYRIDRHRIAIVEPGTDTASLARGSTDGPLQLVSVAALTPGKGHDVLFRGLARVRDGNWTLTCAGSLRRRPDTVDALRALLRAERLDTHVVLVGELDDEALDACYDRADLFVLATLRETYGMAVAEALAHGLPVVSTRTGAIPSLVGPDAGLLVEPGDVDALAVALERMLSERELRARCAAGARRARERLESWDVAVTRMASVVAPFATNV